MVVNVATRKSIAAPPLAVEVLHALDGWRTADGLARAMGAGRGAVSRVLAALERHTLVERAGRERPQERRLDAWREWSPAAALLHFSTKDAPYVDHARGERDLARQRGVRPESIGARSRAGATFEPLAPARRQGEFPAVLLARRTWRRFAPSPLSRDALSTLLGLTFGVQGWMDTGAGGLAPLKTSPSGGARHSIEAYVLARRVTSLAPGLYHYDAVGHGLERLPGRGARRGAAYLPRQPWFAAAPAVVFMTAVFPRVQWRYPHPRAYRAVLAEAGHLCQTFCLTATWLGLAPFCSMALADTAIERDLGVDGVSESVLYAAGVGKRPRGGSGQAPG